MVRMVLSEWGTAGSGYAQAREREDVSLATSLLVIFFVDNVVNICVFPRGMKVQFSLGLFS